MEYLENFDTIVSSVVMILMGVTAIAMIVPGDQPDKTLQKIIDILSKFSRK